MECLIFGILNTICVSTKRNPGTVCFFMPTGMATPNSANASRITVGEGVKVQRSTPDCPTNSAIHDQLSLRLEAGTGGILLAQMLVEV